MVTVSTAKRSHRPQHFALPQPLQILILRTEPPSFVTLVARPIVSGPPAPKPVAPEGACGRAVNLPNLVGYEWLMGDENCHGIVPDGNVGTSWIEIMGGKVGYTNCKECEFWR